MPENNQEKLEPEKLKPAGYKESKKLKIALWFVTHKEIIRRGLIMLLVLLDIFFVVFVFTRFESYLLGAGEEERMLEQMGQQTINYEDWYQKNQPLPLEIIAQTAVSSGRQNYDFIALVKNPNEKWLVSSLEYKFKWDSGESSVAESFILPEEQKYLIAFGEKSTSAPKSVELEFQNLAWKRVTPKLNLPEIKKDVFKISEVEFMPKGVVPINRANFRVKNNSIFNFWTVNFNVILYQGNKIVGANSASLRQFLSGQTREVEVSWTETLPSVTNVVVDPEINILDPDLLMPIVEEGELK